MFLKFKSSIRNEFNNNPDKKVKNCSPDKIPKTNAVLPRWGEQERYLTAFSLLACAACFAVLWTLSVSYASNNLMQEQQLSEFCVGLQNMSHTPITHFEFDKVMSKFSAFYLYKTNWKLRCVLSRRSQRPNEDLYWNWFPGSTGFAFFEEIDSCQHENIVSV